MISTYPKIIDYIDTKEEIACKRAITSTKAPLIINKFDDGQVTELWQQSECDLTLFYAQFEAEKKKLS